MQIYWLVTVMFKLTLGEGNTKELNWLVALFSVQKEDSSLDMISSILCEVYDGEVLI